MNKKIAFAAVSALIIAAPLFALADTLNRQLQVGMSGSDVSALQTFLAKDATLYPSGLVTGYFGVLTKGGVQQFQARNGIVSSGTPATTGYGRVGPVTLAALNAQMAGNVGDTNPPAISGVNVSPSRNSVSVAWNSSEPSAGVLYYSTSWMTLTDTASNDVLVQGSSAATDNSLRTSQNVTATGLQPNTTYYYVAYSKDASGNATITWPTTFTTTN